MISERNKERLCSPAGAGSGTGTMTGFCVTPNAGQDRGRRFLVIGNTDDGRLLLSDGKRRRRDRPKIKKLRHLTVLSDRPLPGWELLSGGTYTDGDVRRILKIRRDDEENGSDEEQLSERRDYSAER